MFSGLGILYQEKSGNPAAECANPRPPNRLKWRLINGTIFQMTANAKIEICGDCFNI
jgi:hypothetical protein